MKKTKFLLLFVFMFYSGNIFAWTRSELRDQIRLLSGDPETTSSTKQRVSDAILNARIEMAQLDIARRTNCLEKTTCYYIYMSTRNYTLPADLLRIERVSYFIKGTTDAYKKMERMTVFGLDDWNNNWQNLGKGLPERYYIWGDSICIVPQASNDYAGSNRLQIEYVARPSTMTADTDIPFNGVTSLYSYHTLIIPYVLSLCKSDEKNGANQAAYYDQKYFNLISLMLSERSAKPDFFPNFNLQGMSNK